MAQGPDNLISLLLLLGGLVGLWGGTHLVVHNSVRVAQRFQVSELFIGLTLLALGTDLPELLVAVDGALRNLRGIPSSGVVVGTAVGSSVAQISFVLGVAALFHYITIANRQLKLLGLELVGATILLFIVAMDGVLTRADGFILMSVFGVYVGHTIINRRGDLEVEPQAEVVVEEAGVPRRALVELALVALGLWIVVLSSDITVEQALHLSRGWGLQQSFVGAILVGIGTSTPELAVSLRAIMHGRTGLSVGNVVGSNIFDLLVPTGVAAVISGLDVDATVIGYDLPYLLLVTLVVIFFLRRVRGLQKWEGAGLLALYLVYAVGRFLLDPR